MDCPICVKGGIPEHLSGNHWRCKRCGTIYDTEKEPLEVNEFIEDKTLKEITNVKEIVLKLLETDIRCRNDDKWLTYKVMRHFTKIFIPFEDFSKIPAFETIKRCRAQIQNVEEKFLATDPEVLAKRKRREKTFKTAFTPTSETYTGVGIL